jgi:hypothetical protein
MPFGSSAAARALSSVQRLLPPSMIMSPASSSSPSLSTSCWVISPAGTISQTLRGGSSFWTSSSMLLAGTAPWLSACCRGASAGSNATTSCSESRLIRWTMLPPMRPRPTKAICIS